MKFGAIKRLKFLHATKALFLRLTAALRFNLSLVISEHDVFNHSLPYLDSLLRSPSHPLPLPSRPSPDE